MICCSFGQGAIAISCNKYSPLQTSIGKAYQLQALLCFAATSTSVSHDLPSGDHKRTVQQNIRTIAASFLHKAREGRASRGPPSLLSRALQAKVNQEYQAGRGYWKSPTLRFCRYLII